MHEYVDQNVVMNSTNGCYHGLVSLDICGELVLAVFQFLQHPLDASYGLLKRRKMELCFCDDFLDAT